jgi:predicted transcriptional regulator of viral defense system
VETLTPERAAEAGLSRSGLYRAAQTGRYERIARGLYRSAAAPPADWDWIEAASRRPDATICLTSALAYHDLIDTIPQALDIAIPRGARIPASSGSIKWHLFDAATFVLGRSEIAIHGTELRMGIYSPERCIVDAFRLRGALGYETGRDALREWLRRGGKPAPLMELATQLPRAKAPLLQMLEALT